LEILQQVASALPAAGKSKEHQRYRRDSEKHRAKGTPVKSRSVRGVGVRPVASGRWRWRGAAVIGPALLAGVVALALFAAAAKGRERGVHIVSGVDRPCTVQIAGKKVQLAANSRQRITVAEGDIAVHVADSSLGIPDSTVHIQTPFWNRPLVSRTFVINPDR